MGFIEGVDMHISVKKADGSKQVFDKDKIVRTCLRKGVPRDVAEQIANKIEIRIYDGIETFKILQMIFRMISRHKPHLKHLTDLRRGLALLKPKPDFELYIQTLLKEHGYSVTPNQIIKGRCGEHEVDAIAKYKGITYIVEVKHHFNFHTPTGLDESRIARALLEDITEGQMYGMNTIHIDKAMIICNTKFSEHAKRYGHCRGIIQIGWSSPPERSLQDLIEEKKLYPITCLKGLKRDTKEKMVDGGIVVLKNLIEKDPEELREETGMTSETAATIIQQAKMCF